jgi:hypothetical protein
MTRLVVLSPDVGGFQARPYDLRVGPLAFTWPAGALEETLGDTLEAVGAALTPAERRPRPLKLPLRIEGNQRAEVDPVTVGRRLRRQVRQLLENPAWLAGGLFLWWRADTELNGWLRVGGGSITESDPGVDFGIWDLELESPYLVGRPVTHRVGRRLDLADRRTGLVPRDTRGTLYATDFSTQALPVEPLVLPGDITAQVSQGNRALSATSGPQRFGRRLWRSAAAVDGDVASYIADPAALPVEVDAYVTLDEAGAVRIWDLTPATTFPPLTTAYTAERDWSPDVYYGWERVFGAQIRSSSAPLAIDNGAIRLIWLGPSAGQGLAFEWYDAGIGSFRREGRILHALNALEAAVVECTPERAVVEWRASDKALRAILQRGWHHVRLESYADDGGTARLEWANDAGAPVVASSTPSWVKTLTTAGRTLYWATGTAADAQAAGTVVSGTSPVAFTRARTVVAQLGSPNATVADVAGWSLADARSVPVLLRRAS